MHNLSDSKLIKELTDEDLQKVSGGVNSITDLVQGNFYTVSGNTTQLFRVDYINSGIGMVICGIYNFDSATKTATNTKGSTTNYKPGDLTPVTDANKPTIVIE